MAITPLPSLDRTSAAFKTDVDTFFGSQLPAFSIEVEAARVAIDADEISAAASAGTATTKAGESSASAAAALASEGAANVSELAAQAAQAAAELALDSFDDRYLGAKAVAPTLDNDGNALLTGAIYFDTVIGGGSWRAWNGSAWITAPAANASSVVNTPSGNIFGTSVQAALNELDAEKALLAGSASQPFAASTLTVATAAGTSIASEGIIAPTLINGWLGAVAPAGYWKDAFGIVHLSGRIKAGVVGTVAFTLPIGYRPTDETGYAVANNEAFGEIVVSINGDVTPQVAAGSTTYWIELSSISFRTN